MAKAKSNADNYIRPEDKARWGFGGTKSKIEVGPQTVGETLEDGETVSGSTTVADVQEARNNGGGADNPKPAAKKSAK